MTDRPHWILRVVEWWAIHADATIVGAAAAIIIAVVAAAVYGWLR